MSLRTIIERCVLWRRVEDPWAMDPEREADRILRSVWTSLNHGVMRIPVDPIRIGRELGIEVFDADLEPSVSGKIAKKAGTDPVILLNRSDHPNRARFTCAHELGHFVQRANDPDDFSYVDKRGPLASTGQNPEEVFANQFAASLLMPESEVRLLLEEGATGVELAWAFRVSVEAMEFRLRNLGFVRR